MPIIEVEHVTKEFRLGQLRSLKQGLSDLALRLGGGKPAVSAPFKALDDVSFNVGAGEVLGIIGHNGAGKSTLLKILAGISKPTSGRVAVRGKVAPLIEVGAGLVPDLTGRENIYLNATILGMKRAEIARKFDEMVAFAELEEFIDTPVKRYSSGMQIRLGFSIATSVEADILIVDEVLAVGDLAFQRKCFDRMEDLIKRDGRTVLLVSHNIRQVERICGRAILLTSGRVACDGASPEVCRLLQDESRRKMSAEKSANGTPRISQADTGDIRVLSIELLAGQESAPTTRLLLNESARVRVRFYANRDISAPEIHVGVHTPDFVYVLAASTNELAERPAIQAGESVFECAFEVLPLKPGLYYLRLAFREGLGRTLWYDECLCPFNVEPGRTNLSRKPELWLVDVPAKWTFGADGTRSLHSERASA